MNETEKTVEKKFRKKEIIFTVTFLFICYIVFLSFISGGWIIYHDKPYKGQVVDAETGEPIKGAIVVAVWYVEQYGGVGGSLAAYLNAEETITDKDGRYRIPHMFGFYYWPLSIMTKPRILVYKPSFTSYERYQYKKRQILIKHLN